MLNKSLAHYKVTELIGRGGMGEVYRATDTRLGRDVALKILPPEFSEDPERRARFEREARTLATLQHPNVASLYGFEEADVVRFLVMELAQGEDLGKYIARGLSIEDAVDIAAQIALGLEAAHDKGIVHRDLKPANVQIAADGTVKLLDFGLARAWEDENANANPDTSPTITSAGVTAHGIILGTAAYMSPEQARGKNVDRQTDVWAFGCVLYEMLSGKAAYRGDTITDTLAAIIHKEADWTALPPQTPAHLRRLIELCLQKSPGDRLRDARDIRLLLAAPPTEDNVDAVIAAPIATRTNRMWPALAALFAVALVVSLFTGRSTSPGGTAAVSEDIRIAAMEQLTDRIGIEQDPSLSPDARMLLYAARDNGDLDIFLQRVGGENPINLTADHDGDDFQPSFSPDGQRVAFCSTREGGGTFVMGATGETPLRVADFGFDPAWSPDGRSLVVTEERVTNPYSRGGLANLWIIDLESRDKRQLLDLDAAAPSWSPGGQRIAFWSHLTTIKGQRDIYTVGMDGSDPQAVTLDAATDWDPVWSADGRWLYFLSDRGGSPDLWRQRIDETTGETLGTPQPVTAGMTSLLQVAIARNGQMALMSQEASSELVSIPFDVANLRVTGKPTTLLASNNLLVHADTSEDGEWLVYRTTAPAEHIYIMRRDGSSRRRIVATEHRNRGPKFLPGTDWILFYSNRSQVYQIWAIRRDGSGLKQLTGNPQQDITSPVLDSRGRIYATYEAPEFTLGELVLPEGGVDAVETPLDMQPIESIGFGVSAVTPGGQRLAGYRRGRGGIAIYTVSSGTLEPVELEGEPIWSFADPVWLDEQRLLFWEPRLESAIVWDAEQRAATLLPDVPGPAIYLLLKPQGALFANKHKIGSEIWLVTVESSL